MSNGRSQRLKIGINYPAMEYGWDFGMPPRSQRNRPWTARGSIFNEHGGPQVLSDCNSPKRQWVPWQQDFNAFMDCFKCLGIDIVRWNLLGDCYNYGKARFLSEGDWEVTDTELTTCFIEDFKQFLGLCAAKDIQLIPVFIDHRAFWPGVQVVTGCEHATTKLSQVARADKQSPEDWIKSTPVQKILDGLRSGESDRYKGGRGDLLLDPKHKDPFKAKRGRRQEFFDKVIAKLLEAANSKPEYKRVIYAWDLMNEPELAFAVGKDKLGQGSRYGNGSDIYHEESELTYQAPKFNEWEPKLELQDMREFLLAGARLVKDADFKWTVGFQRFESLTDDKLLPKTLPKDLEPAYLPQFHYYGQPAPLPAPPKSWTNPCFVGEFALADPKKPAEKWHDQPQGPEIDKLGDRMQLLAARGYQLGLGWSARGAEGKPDPRSAWTKDVCAAIAQQHGKGACQECDRTFQAQARIKQWYKDNAAIVDDNCKQYKKPEPTRPFVPISRPPSIR